MLPSDSHRIVIKDLLHKQEMIQNTMTFSPQQPLHIFDNSMNHPQQHHKGMIHASPLRSCRVMGTDISYGVMELQTLTKP